MVDEPREPELIRPYVIANDTPPRRASRPAARRPVDDPTDFITRDGNPDDDVPPDDAPGRWRPHGGLAVAAGAVAVGLLLVVAYLVWPSDPGPAGTPLARTPPTGATVSPDAATTRTAPTASASSTRPSPSHRPTPSPSAPTSSPSRSLAASPLPPPPAGPIVGVGGRCVADTAGRAQLTGCDGSAAQTWTVAADGTLRIQGRCLRAASTPGARTDVADCDGSPAETWRTGSHSTLVNVASGLCLDVAAPDTDPAPVDVATCTGGKRQRWHLP